MDWLLRPTKLWTRAEVIATPCPVPAESGVYGWFFDDPPPHVPLVATHRHEGHNLLYVGIAPRKPSAGGKASSRTLRDRLRQHYRLNAYGSTLRLSLGCLLGMELHRIASRKYPGTAKRMTFGSHGEGELNHWMDSHARVVWRTCPEPWVEEHHLMTRLVLPLNLDGNRGSGFHATLSQVRAEARVDAKARPPLYT